MEVSMVNGAKRNPQRNYFFSEEMRRMDTVLTRNNIAFVSALQVLRAPARAFYQFRQDNEVQFLVHDNGAWSHRHQNNGTVYQTGLGADSLALYLASLPKVQQVQS
jgi:hypothetical protein